MLRKISKFTALVMLVTLAAGCTPKNPSPTSSAVEELRLLTPEQIKFLQKNAERVEQKEEVRQTIKNDKGEVLSTQTSQTTVIYLKPSAGGGKFNVNATCSGTCSGIPTNICPDASTCSCKKVPNDYTGTCQCAGCNNDSSGCTTGTCASVKVGFGDFGIFIVKNENNPPDATVALK